jgi:predicted porin
MQKKLMAVAVAGVLGAPALALAQTSTVQIYGTLYVEYAYIDQGNSGPAGRRQNVDILQTPGSNVGFKGEEKLGGGLSAWFQCESTADPRGQSQDGWCSRNSALGLKGGFGNVFIGNWDTPFKRTISPTNVGGNDTGVFGTANLLTGGSTTVFGIEGRANFKRRQQNLIAYDSPNFAGFQVMAAVTALNHATSVTGGASNAKPRIWSLGAQYSAGPLYVSGGYEKHKEYGSAIIAGDACGVGNATGCAAGSPAGTPDFDDDGWHVGAAYTWGPVRFGGQYTRQRFEQAPGRTRVNAWHVGVDWNIVGPHGLRAAYTQAGDVKGPAGAAAVAGTQGQARSAPGGNTGAKQYQIRYVYNFSKRTEFTFGYVKLDNEAAAQYDLFGIASTTAASPGNNQDAWAIGLRHNF